MDNEKQKQEDLLLQQILNETAPHATQKRTSQQKTPVFSHAATTTTTSQPQPKSQPQAPKPTEAPLPAASSAPQPQPTADPADTIVPEAAPKPQKKPAATERILSPEEQALYEDLDGISQTHAHRRKSTASTAAAGKKKKKRKHSLVIRSMITALLILVVSIVLAVLIITYGRDILGINNDTATKIVTIPQGANTEEIADLLESEGIITYPKLFKLFAGLSGKDANFTAGDHELRPDMAYDTIFENLASPSLGSEDVVTIAFQEGIYLSDAAEELEQQGVCDADEFLEAFNEARFDLAYEEYLPSFTTGKFYKMEGYLFPDTYQFYKNMDVELVCQKILRNFNSKITTRDYERMEELGISLDETLTLASMIQMEAGSVDQMSRISSVFWNRLNDPAAFPKLQSDPTINYVENVIKPHIASYDEDMFTGYNTYECDGLPAGAICNPGYDAIEAALYPASTEYYYFYSNLNTGETYFSRTLAEHEAWIKKVEGNPYVATEPADIDSSDASETTNVIVGVATTAAEDTTETTTTQAGDGSTW
jgi:UPF0755 protein